MGLALYYKDDNDQFVMVSNGQDQSSPITTIHNGRTGDVKIMQLFLRNDNDEKWFSNIVILPLDTIDANPYGDVGYSETGWGVKLLLSSGQPSINDWEDTKWGESILIDSIGSDESADISTYVPFWYYITCPPNHPVAIKTDITLEVNYTENSVA